MADLLDSDERKYDGKPTSAAIREQLGLILRSAEFRAAGRTSQLLTYLVDQTLIGKACELKEYVIGVEVFGKPAHYDPHSDSIVRVQAGRLRARLAAYYATEGRSDPVLIDLAPGSYAPGFRMTQPQGRHPTSNWKRLAIAGALHKRTLLPVLLVLTVIAAVAIVVSPRLTPGSRLTPAKASDHRGSQNPSQGTAYAAPYSSLAETNTKLSAYEAAVLRYPNSAEAWAILANSYCVFMYLTDSQREDLARKASDAAKRALELNPDLAPAQAALAWIDFYYGWDAIAAELSLRKTLSFKPECEMCREWHALMLAASGKSREAITEAGSMAKGTPSSYFAAAILSSVLYYGSNFSEAEREARFAVSLDPANGHARETLIASLVASTQARGVFAIMPPPDQDEQSQGVQARFVSAYAQSGDQNAARQLLKALEERAKREEGSYTTLALAYAGLGDRKRVVSSLRTAVQRREPDLVFVAVEPALAAYRSDKEFMEILAAVRAPKKPGPVGAAPQ